MGRPDAPLTGVTQTCPFCGSSDAELVSPWGSQLITSLFRCGSCNTHFEALREDFAGPETPRTGIAHSGGDQ
jgi:transposase-like protein